ncbi:MAG TPA: phosphotransferase [Myxococcales bacterium]|nr:phosphotransferase [Myxococcales bacterium]
MAAVHDRISELVGSLFPEAVVESIETLAPDSGPGPAGTRKVEGYGEPMRVALRGPKGEGRTLVFRTASTNIFGHDRRSDRAAGMLLSYDTFPAMPDHVRALDVGAILGDGRLVSLRGSGEFYLLTTFAEGRMYANHLRRIAAECASTPDDLARCESLACWLARLHGQRIVDPDAYTRAVRDLLGHGEGIFGMVDGYGPDVLGASPARLRAIEERCLAWRWRLRGRENRLSRIHGDFHPFNVVVDGDGFTLLDASRGCRGDPADDVTAMAVNYVFFALSATGSWASGFAPLWRRFWEVYLGESNDHGLLAVTAPWLAWRCLVVCSPRFYPGLAAGARDALLGLAERALESARFDPAWAEELFR